MSGKDDNTNADAADDPTFWDRVAHTPLSDAIRREWKKRPTVARILRAQALPPRIVDLITQVLRSARLWRSERRDVARELAAHFADGLEVGRTTDDLIASFGDPDQAARLIRITKKRNRPLWWRASRNTLRGLAATIALVILFYAALTVRFFMGSPTISHDYVADLNRIAAAAPEHRRAWPVYRQALLALEERPILVIEESPTAEEPPSQEYREYLIRNAVAFELAHEAALIRHLGFELSYNISRADRELWPEHSPGDPAGGVYAIRLPFLTPFRDFARLLAADAIRAAEDGDGATALRNVETLVRMAGHVREHPILISDLVAFSILAVALETTGGLLEVHADLFTHENLVSLAHVLASAFGGDMRVRVESERITFHDFLQRAFTDDGRGGGRLTPAGVRFVSNIVMIDPEEVSDFTKWALSPGVSLVIANRRDLRAKWDELINEVQADAALPLWERTFETDQSVEMMRGTLAEKRYLPIVLLFPAISRASVIGDQSSMRRDGILVAIALELYRREHGEWPASLDDLSPRYLPAVPRDRFDGKPLRYAVRDGRPVVYSIGTNGEDNGGVPPMGHGGNLNEASRWMSRSHRERLGDDYVGSLLPQGDWILWPRLPSNWKEFEKRPTDDEETVDPYASHWGGTAR